MFLRAPSWHPVAEQSRLLRGFNRHVCADHSHSSIPSHISPGRQNHTPSCLLGSSIWMSHSTSASWCLKQHCLPPSSRTSCFLAFPTSGTTESSCSSQKLEVTLTFYSFSLAPLISTTALVSHTPVPSFFLLKGSWFASSPLPFLAQATIPTSYLVQGNKHSQMKPDLIMSLPFLSHFWGSPVPHTKPT